jgi:urate oxidase
MKNSHITRHLNGYKRLNSASISYGSLPLSLRESKEPSRTSSLVIERSRNKRSRNKRSRNKSLQEPHPWLLSVVEISVVEIKGVEIKGVENLV